MTGMLKLQFKTFLKHSEAGFNEERVIASILFVISIQFFHLYEGKL